MEPDPSHASLGDQGIEPARERIGDDRSPELVDKEKAAVLPRLASPQPLLELVARLRGELGERPQMSRSTY